MAIRAALMFVVLLFVTGCVTHDWTAKAVSGTVVDADSGEALSGVIIYRMFHKKSVLVATTDAAGQFSVAAAGLTYVTLPTGGDPFYHSFLIFRAPGYAEQKLDCSSGTGDAVGWKAPTLPPATVKLRKKV
jgi:hypothetical protein